MLAEVVYRSVTMARTILRQFEALQGTPGVRRRR
jgi:hypothetical protein